MPYTAPNTANKTRTDAFFSMSLVVLASCPDLCDHDALRTLADTPHPCAHLLATSKAMRGSILVKRLLLAQCMQGLKFKRDGLARAVWAASVLLKLHTLTQDQTAQLLTTISVLMPVVHVYNDSSARSLQVRLRAFDDIRRARLPELLATVLAHDACRGLAAERGLCCLQNCMVNIDGGGFFDTAIDLQNIPLRESIISALLNLHAEHCERHLTHEVLNTCMLVELSTAGTATRILDAFFNRVVDCVHQRLPIHATYVHMGIVRLLRRHDTLGVHFWILNDNVLERLLVSIIIACGDDTTHDSLLIALTVITEHVASARFRQPWQDTTLCEQFITTIAQVATRDIPALQPSIAAMVRVVVRTFCSAFSAATLARMLDLVLVHLGGPETVLSLVEEMTLRCGRALGRFHAWERVLWYAVSVANAPLTTNANVATCVNIVLQGVRWAPRPMLLALLQQLGFLRRGFVLAHKVMANCMHILRIICTRLESMPAVDLRSTLHAHHIVQGVVSVAHRMLESPPTAQNTLIAVMRTMQILSTRGIAPGLNAVYVQLDLCGVLWSHPRVTMRQRQKALAIVDEAVLMLGRTPHTLCAVRIIALVHILGTGEGLVRDLRHGIILLYMHILLAAQQKCLCMVQNGSAACGIMIAACLDCVQNVESMEYSMFVMCVRCLLIMFSSKGHHHVQAVVSAQLRAKLLQCHEHFAFHLACDAHTSQVLQNLLEVEALARSGAEVVDPEQ